MSRKSQHTKESTSLIHGRYIHAARIATVVSGDQGRIPAARDVLPGLRHSTIKALPGRAGHQCGPHADSEHYKPVSAFALPGHR
jgi:hypothetical protein